MGRVETLPKELRSFVVGVQFYVPLEAKTAAQAKRTVKQLLEAHLGQVTCSEPEYEVIAPQ